MITTDQKAKAFCEGAEACRAQRGNGHQNDNPYHADALRRMWNAGWNSIVDLFVDDARHVLDGRVS